MHPDAFVLQLLNDQHGVVIAALAADRAILVKPPLTADEYLLALEHDGPVGTASALRRLDARL
jgi:hypothetical protein